MDLQIVGFGAAAIGTYALVSGRLNRTVISGPMFFTAAGIVVAVIGLTDEPGEELNEAAKVTLEMTLALVLFTDAAATRVRSWKAEGELPGRLLAVGMPLIIVAGAAAGVLVVPEIDLVDAAIVATVLAPTDAALGKPVVSNKRVPVRIREALNIESGLNDGIALPFLLFFVALAEREEGASFWSLFFSAIGVAVIVGAAVGWALARLIILSSDRGWMLRIGRQVVVVAGAAVAYVVTDELGGSGFIATFVGGLIFGRLISSAYPDIAVFAEELAELLTMVAFMVFGALVLQPSFGDFTWEMAIYAGLSLTVVRLVPVAISMVGTPLRPPSVLYLGWFGPRGLASLIFSAIVIEEADLPVTDPLVTVITLTVALSVLFHGLTAYLGANAYAEWYGRQHEDHSQMIESKDVTEVPQRRRVARP